VNKSQIINTAEMVEISHYFSCNHSVMSGGQRNYEINVPDIIQRKYQQTAKKGTTGSMNITDTD
jgi:hypothetical protein